MFHVPLLPTNAGQLFSVRADRLFSRLRPVMSEDAARAGGQVEGYDEVAGVHSSSPEVREFRGHNTNFFLRTKLR